MPIIPFVNLKGGVAKTTNAVALAESLADSGHRVLVIDADHQCMAGELLLGEDRLDKAERGRRTLHDLLAAMLDDGTYPESILPTSTAAKAIVRDRPMLNPKHPYRIRAKAAGWLPGDGSGNLAREVWGEGKVLLLKKLSDKDPAHKRWSTLVNRPFL